MGFEDEPVEHIKVAITTFAFKNAEIIKLLQERGDIIKSESWDQMKEIDAKINEIKNEHLVDLMTPCSVFMTFENEEGVNRAMNFNEAIEADANLQHLGRWLGDFKIEVQKASEPSDIIWENRHFTNGQRLKKKLIVILLMTLLLLSSFCLIFACASYSLKLIRVYPDVTCSELNESGNETAM